MNKQILLNTLTKSFLSLTGVDQYFIFLDVKDDSLLMKTINVAYKSTVVSQVSITNTGMKDCKVVIREPDRLVKLLGIKKDEIEVILNDKTDVRLCIKDGKITTDFTLADPKVLPKSIMEQYSVEVEEPDVYEISIPVTSEFVETFSKLKKALSTEVFSVECSLGSINIGLGENNDYSTKSTFKIENASCETEIDTLLFSSDTLLAILDRNKNCNGTIYVNSNGLLKIEYDHTIDTSKQKATYFMVALDQL